MSMALKAWVQDAYDEVDDAIKNSEADAAIDVQNWNKGWRAALAAVLDRIEDEEG